MDRVTCLRLDDTLGIPEEIRRLRRLRRLHISGEFAEVPDWLAELPLRTLRLVASDRRGRPAGPREFPEAVLRLPALRVLRLSHFRFTSVPAVIAAALPRLRRLELTAIPVRELPTEVLAMATLETIILRGTALPAGFLDRVGQRDSLCQELAGDDTPRGRRRLWMALLVADDEAAAVAEASVADLVHAAQAGPRNAPALRAGALRALERRCVEPHLTLRPGGNVVITGRLTADHKPLVQRLRRAGVARRSRPDPDTCAIILGPRPGRDRVEPGLASGVPVGVETHLYAALDRLDPPPLPTPAVDPVTGIDANQLGAMLMSPDEVDRQLALSIMDRRGVPATVLEELLLLVWHDNRPGGRGIRRQARRLLARYAPPRLRDAVADVFAVGPATPGNLGSRLAELAVRAGESVDIVKLCLLALPSGRDYLLREHADDDAVMGRVLAAVRDGDTLELADCGLDRVPAALGRQSGLRAVSLRDNQFTRFPAPVLDLDGLDSLDLRNNHLDILPDSIARLTSLTTLNLLGNAFTEFPDALTALSSLTTLSLGGNLIDRFPADLTRLTNLTTLHLFGNRFDRFPTALLGLSRLRSLHLGGAFAPRRHREDHPVVEQWSVARTLTGAVPIDALAALEELDLSYHDHVVLPESMRALTRLRLLSLDHTSLQALPGWLTELPALTEVSMKFTRIADWATTRTTVERLGERGVRLRWWFTAVDAARPPERTP